MSATPNRKQHSSDSEIAAARKPKTAPQDASETIVKSHNTPAASAALPDANFMVASGSRSSGHSERVPALVYMGDGDAGCSRMVRSLSKEQEAILGLQNARAPVVMSSTLKPGARSLMSSQFGRGIIQVETIISEASPAKQTKPAAKKNTQGSVGVADNSDQWNWDNISNSQQTSSNDASYLVSGPSSGHSSMETYEKR